MNKKCDLKWNNENLNIINDEIIDTLKKEKDISFIRNFYGFFRKKFYYFLIKI